MALGKLILLGGYGNAGLALARLLLDRTDCRLILAGRDRAKAQKTADDLNAQCEAGRVEGRRVDVSEPGALVEAFREPGLELVVAASSTAVYAREVAHAALEAGIDYYDIQYSGEKLDALRSMGPEIERAGRCFITDGGFHPGLPAAMIRYAARRFDRLETAIVGSVVKVDWAKLSLSGATLEEFVREFADFNSEYFQEGRWIRAGWREMLAPRRIDFGPVYGRQYCVPMTLAEMRSLPGAIPSLNETGFFIAGFNWFVDWILSPLIMLTLRMFPEKGLRPTARWLRWGLDRFSKPPFGTLVKLEARGVVGDHREGMTMTVFHEDGYMATAIPAAACLLQVLDGTIRKPGLRLQAEAVEPGRFMEDLERLGMRVNFRFSQAEKFAPGLNAGLG
jgi:saccharopine dehydrogenase (NAD+, L-lysine-forming)